MAGFAYLAPSEPRRAEQSRAVNGVVSPREDAEPVILSILYEMNDGALSQAVVLFQDGEDSRFLWEKSFRCRDGRACG